MGPPLGLASLLHGIVVLIGIYSSAIYISQDAKLRQSFRHVAIRESKLLDSIGTAHMEKEIERKVKVLVGRNQDTINEETGIHSSETEEDMSYPRESQGR
jgi:hypothetical protein